MRTSDLVLAMIAAGSVAACSDAPDNGELARVEAEQARAAAAGGRVSCALAGAAAFRTDCTLDRIASADGEVLVIGRTDAGFRRFRLTGDGRGLEAADGAEPASVTVIDGGQIEVRVADDRYRLPATVRNAP